MQVFRSMIMEHPVDKVWSAVRAFDGVANWNPGVAAAHMERGGATEIGAIRHLDIADGAVFRETLLAHSDDEWMYRYDILDSPLPVTNYVSTHRFIPITATNQCLGIWESTFDCAGELGEEMDKVVGDIIYIGGMTGLNNYLKDNRNA